MLAPHELKNAEFTKSLRGYSTVEVDEHIDFLIENIPSSTVLTTSLKRSSGSQRLSSMLSRLKRSRSRSPL